MNHIMKFNEAKLRIDPEGRMRNILKFKDKIKPDDDFVGQIDDLLIDLNDLGFKHQVENKKSTYNIKISAPYPPRVDSKWKIVKSDIVRMVNYLQDVYPKMQFSLFSATIKTRRYSSDNKSAYNINDFLKMMNDSDELEYVFIKCVLRNRGKNI